MDKRLHLLVSITAHGFGHVAQVAPVVNGLRERLPELDLTVHSSVPLSHLQSRIRGPFVYQREVGDIGMRMSSSMDVRVQETAEAYQTLHYGWNIKIGNKARALKEIAPDFVLCNVSYLPLAGARMAGIPCAAMCSLNWADIYAHYCGGFSGARHVIEHIAQAYAHADAFLQPAPSMPMTGLNNRIPLGPVAETGINRRTEIDRVLNLTGEEKLVLVSLGGESGRLPVDDWPRIPGVRWLVAANWNVRHPDAILLESLEMDFRDVLASCDALVCKPGYGSFVEAACNGVPVLFVSRDDWPETAYLKRWLHANAHGVEISRSRLESGKFGEELLSLWSRPAFTPVKPDGVDQAVDWLSGRLLGRS